MPSRLSGAVPVKKEWQGTLRWSPACRQQRGLVAVQFPHTSGGECWLSVRQDLAGGTCGTPLAWKLRAVRLGHSEDPETVGND